MTKAQPLLIFKIGCQGQQNSFWEKLHLYMGLTPKTQLTIDCFSKPDGKV